MPKCAAGVGEGENMCQTVEPGVVRPQRPAQLTVRRAPLSRKHSLEG